MYMNRVIILGNITRDVEIKAIPGGSSVANFSIATNRTWTGKDGKKQEQSEFHSCVAFARQAEIIAQYCKKGSTLLVEGRIQTRSWEKDGQKHYRTEIVVENMQLGPRPVGTTAPQPQRPMTPDEVDAQIDQGLGIEPPKDEVNPDDIPF
jgi:single-strand DNA-binding protein